MVVRRADSLLKVNSKSQEALLPLIRLVLSLSPPSCIDMASFKAKIQGTIRKDDFQRNTALQRCCEVSNGNKLQRCVALKIVIANRPV